MSHRRINLSEIFNDCTLDLCVDTTKGESLISILAKICEANPSGGEGGCCYEFVNSDTIVWTVDGNTVSAASIGVSELDSGDLVPLFTTDVSNPTSTPYLSFTLNTQDPNEVFASPVSGVGLPDFRSLVMADMPFDVGDFIQNQLITDQVADWRISGSGQVGTYLQVSDASRIVKDSTGTLAITQDTSSTIGDHLRVRHLKFFDDTSPGTAGTCNSEIYATQGDDLVIYTPGAFGALKLDSPFVRIGNGITKPILAPGGFHPLTIFGSDAEVGNYDYLELYNANEAGLSPESLKTRLTFAGYRENGTPIVDIGLPGGNPGDKQRLGAFGIEVISTDEVSYKADFLWETVDGDINTGLPTEQLRLTYDGRIIASAYSTLLAAPTPNGLKHMLTCDEDGLFSHEAIPAGGVGSVSSVALSMPSAFSVANSPITNSGTLVVTGAGTTGQYIRGDGSLGSLSAFFPTWQQTLITGSLLTQNNTIDIGGDTNTLIFQNGSFVVNSTHTGNVAISVNAGDETFLASPDASQQFSVRDTGYFLEALAAGTTSDRLVGYDVSNKTLGALTLSGLSISSGVLGITGVPISKLLAATATNTIANGNFTQTWNWPTLTSGALLINAASTAMSNSSYVFGVTTSGVNASSGIESRAVHFQNTHTGTSSTNNAIYATASGGTVNNALYISAGNLVVDAGDIFFNTLSVSAGQDRLIGQNTLTKEVNAVGIGSGLQLVGGVLSSTAVGGTPGLQDVITQDNLLLVNNTINVNGTNLTFENCTNFIVEGAGAYVNVPLIAVHPGGQCGFGDYGYQVDGIGVWIDPTDASVGLTLRCPGPNDTFFKIGGYGSANNGDVLILLDNTTGAVGWAAPGGAPGSVTNFSAGNLAPLFTSNVATSTTTPALTFSLTNAGAHTYFGNNTGGSAAPAYKSNAALTKTDDTNVTLTLGGSPTTALLEAASITVGWTGSLAVGRGGTGITSYTIGDTVYASGSTTLSKLPIGTAGQILRVNAGATAPEWYTQTFNSGTVTSFSAGDLSPLFTTTESTATTTPALTFVLTNAGANTYFGNATGGATSPSYTSAGALTTVSDTNIVLTVGGNAATSLLRSASVTATWNGVLGVARGGTSFASYTAGDIIVATGGTTLSKLAIGAPGQQLRVDGGGTGLEYFTAGPGITTLNTLTDATQLFATGTTGTDFNISSSVDTHTFNIPSASLANRGLVTIVAQSFEGVKTFNLGTIINESGANTAAGGDFRVESDTNTDAIHVDATNNRVGILTAPGAFGLDIGAISTRIQGNLGVGGSPSGNVALTIGGSAWTAYGLNTSVTISALTGSTAAIANFGGTLIENTSGTHPVFATIFANPFATTAGLAGVTTAATIYIAGEPTTVGAVNSALHIAAGTFRAAGDWIMGTGTASTGAYSLIVRNQSTGRLETIEPDVLSFSSQAASGYTLVLTDKGKMVQRSNGSAQTVTIPTNASVAFPVGTTILIEQTGAGQITFIPSGGVTMNSADSATKTRVQWVVASLIKTATNTWTLTGDIVV